MKLLPHGLVPQKSQFLLVACLLFITPFFAQVGIGTVSPDPSSELDIQSDDGGLLIPRMTALDRTAITSPATGLMVYQTDAPDGFYYYDGTVWQEISAGKNDAWYEESTTNEPDDINDDIFTMGNVAIGKNTADYLLDVESAGTDVASFLVTDPSSSLSAVRSILVGTAANGIGSLTSIQSFMNVTGNSTKYGFRNTVGTASVPAVGRTVGIKNTIVSESASGQIDFAIGIENEISGDDLTDEVVGTKNNIHVTNSSVDIMGVNNIVSGTTGVASGTYNEFLDDGISNQKNGVNNYFRGNLDGTLTGVRNFFVSGPGTKYGVYNYIQGIGDNEHYGSYNLLGSGGPDGDGDRYATYNRINETGNGTKYGSYNIIDNSNSGDLYGVYSRVTRASGNAFAGYFLGKVAIGSGTTNTYILPETRGTAGQVMQSGGSGIVAWVDANTLNVDDDDDWVTVGANIERQSGNVLIGDDATTDNDIYISDRIIDWDDTTKFIDPNGISSVNQILYENGTIANPSIRFSDANTGIFSPAVAEIGFSINGTERIRIDNIGQLGIRQTNPLFDVHVKQLSNLEGGTGGVALESALSTVNWRTYHSGAHFSFAENGVRRAYVSTGTGAYIQPSDERLKLDFQLQNNYLSKLKQLSIYSYLYKSQKTNERSLGVKAQEIQPLFPELISEGEDGYLGMNYAGLSVVAIQAIKEQQDVIETLSVENENLKEKTNTLENRLDQLLSRLEVMEAKLNE